MSLHILTAYYTNCDFFVKWQNMLTLLHSRWPKLNGVLTILEAIGLCQRNDFINRKWCNSLLNQENDLSCQENDIFKRLFLVKSKELCNYTIAYYANKTIFSLTGRGVQLPFVIFLFFFFHLFLTTFGSSVPNED